MMTDLRFALRTFFKSPTTTLVVVVSLAVAIATSTIISSTIDVIWHFIPAAQRDRLVFVASTDPRPGQSQSGVSDGVAWTGVSVPDLMDWSERTTTFQEFAGFTFGSANLTSTDLPLRVTTIRATSNLLSVWGIRPMLGRTFRPEEGRPDAAAVVVMSHSFWQSQFSGQPNVLGRTLMLNGEAHTLIGVLPPEASVGVFKQRDVFVPFLLDPARAPRDERRLYLTGVLKRGVMREQAAADLDVIVQQLQREYPGTNAHTGVVVRPLIEMVHSNQLFLVLLGVIAVLVLGIACANVSNVILARATARRRELAVRAALGASRFHQIRQLMIESFVSSSVAGAAGLLLAWWGLTAIRTLAGSGVFGFNEMALNGRVLAIGVVVSFLAPFGFALLPAIRMSIPDVEELRQGNRGAESVRGHRLREVLVAVQVALALMLMIQVGLIVRTAWRFHNLENGFDPMQLLTMRVELPAAKYPEPHQAREFFTQAITRIQALPGVTSVGAVTRLPIADRELYVHFAIEGSAPLPPESQPSAARSAITPDYLKTMRIPVIRGRGLTPADFGNVPPVALVNQEAARRYWPNADPIGKRIMFDPPEAGQRLEIVGIAGNVRNSDAGSEPTPQIFVPSSWQPERAMAMVVRTAAPASTQLAPAIRAQLAQLDKDQPVYDVATMERLLFDDLGSLYMLAGMLSVIGFVALCLAAAGVYGLISYSVSQRTREIGLRMALGAQPSEVLRMVLTQGSVPVAFGLVLGAAAAVALTYLSSAAMQDFDLRDPIAYIGAFAPFVAVAFIATFIPARRATHVDPMLALRAE